MTDNEITREKTFSEELPYFKERIKEVYDYYDNPNGCLEMLYIDVLRDSNRVVRKAEEEINRQQAEIDKLNAENMLTTSERNAFRTSFYDILKQLKSAKSEAVKEFAERLKNKIKTECNPYGKPTFDYDTSIAIMHYIDNLVKEMVGDNNAE